MGMDVIYIDSLFLLNLIINYFILLATARICGVHFRRLRYALAAALGAAYAVAVAFPTLAMLATAPMKLVLGCFMALIAFGGETKLIRKAAAFFAVSAAFGGVVFGASMLAGGSISASSVLAPVSMRMLVLSFAVCYVVMTIVFKRLGQRAQHKVHQIEAENYGVTVKFQALADTGNELYDPVTGGRVMVCELKSVIALFPVEKRKLLENAKLSPIELVLEMEGMLRLIPFTAVGVEMSMLPAFKPDKLWVDDKLRGDVLLAISPTALCSTGEHTAIL